VLDKRQGPILHTIVSYNASAVKIPTPRLNPCVWKAKKYFTLKNVLANYNAGVVVVNSEVVGLVPDTKLVLTFI
jgi:hypothetical protein